MRCALSSAQETRQRFLRMNNGEDNADAHLKRQLMAHQVVLAITDGRLDLGPWEQCSTPSSTAAARKRVLLKAIGD